VFDALRTDWLEREERGAGAAVSVLGYRIAMLVSGAGALILADLELPQASVLVTDGAVEALAHIGQAEMHPGDVFEIHTPGGGGYGAR